MWIESIRFPAESDTGGIVANSLGGHNWLSGMGLFLVIGAIMVAMMGQELWFAWRNWRAASRRGAQQKADELRPAKRLEDTEPSGRVTAEIEHSAARQHTGHHVHVRPQHRFWVDNRVNKPTNRGYRQR